MQKRQPCHTVNGFRHSKALSFSEHLYLQINLIFIHSLNHFQRTLFCIRHCKVLHYFEEIFLNVACAMISLRYLFRKINAWDTIEEAENPAKQKKTMDNVSLAWIYTKCSICCAVRKKSLTHASDTHSYANIYRRRETSLHTGTESILRWGNVSTHIDQCQL